MFSSINNITGQPKDQNGNVLSSGQIVCGGGVISDITGIIHSVDQTISGVANNINTVSTTLLNDVNIVTNDAQSLITFAENRVQSLLTSALGIAEKDLNTATTDLKKLLPEVNFCNIFDSKSSLSHYYSAPYAAQAVNMTNPINYNINRPLPSKIDTQLGMSQINRLSLGDDPNNTIVQQKNSQRELSIPTAFYKSTWSEPYSPYNAAYPYNATTTTRNGIVVEYDDTPGSTRIHEYHPSGTYREVDQDGTHVNKITGDDYEIILKNKKLYIKGNLDVTVDSGVTILVNGDCNLDIHGNLQATVRNDLIAAVSNSVILNTANNMLFKANNMLFECNTYSINACNTIKIHSNAIESIALDTNIIQAQNTIELSSKSIVEDSQSLYIGSSTIYSPSIAYPNATPCLHLSGTSTKPSTTTNSIDASGVTAPIYTQTTPQQPAIVSSPMNNLYVKQQIQFADASSPGNAPPSIFITPKLYESQQYTTQAVSYNTTHIPAKNIDTSSITSLQSFPLTAVLSKYCTLGDLTKHCAVTHDSLTAQFSLSKAQIAGNLMQLTQNCIDPIFDKYGRGNVRIVSAFRLSNGIKEQPNNIGNGVDLQFLDLSLEQYAGRVSDLGSIIPFNKMQFCYVWNGISYTPYVHVEFMANQAQAYTIETVNLSTESLQVGLFNPFIPINTSVTRTDGIK